MSCFMGCIIGCNLIVLCGMLYSCCCDDDLGELDIAEVALLLVRV